MLLNKSKWKIRKGGKTIVKDEYAANIFFIKNQENDKRFSIVTPERAFVFEATDGTTCQILLILGKIYTAKKILGQLFAPTQEECKLPLGYLASLSVAADACEPVTYVFYYIYIIETIRLSSYYSSTIKEKCKRFN